MKMSTVVQVRADERLPQRAYSLLEIKSVDNDKRIIEGIASTPTTDRMGDIVEPDGAQFKLPLPFLYQHNARQPIGHVITAKVTKEGILVKIQIAAAGVALFIDEAWALIKAGLVRGLSIGFRSVETADIKGTFGVRFIKWDWYELSAVTIPANAEANIQSIKSIDAQHLRAAHGETESASVVRLAAPPGATGNTSTVPKGKTMKTVQEQTASFEAKRAANAARMQDIMSKSGDEGRTLDDTEAQEYDALNTEIKQVDAHLVRLRAAETAMIQTAQPLRTETVNAPEPAAAIRSTIPGVTWGKSQLPKGTAFIRYVMAMAATKGVRADAIDFAHQWKESTPQVENAFRNNVGDMLQKAAMTVGTTTHATWAEPLVEFQTMASEFIDLLRPATIIGRLPNLRRVPFNIRVAGKTQGATVGWVGQGAPKPVSELAFNETTLGFAKAAGIVVISQELARFSSPSAEDVIRRDMVDTMVLFLDQQFIDPAVAAVANVSPASVTNGATKITSTGTTIAQITADVEGLVDLFLTANLATTGLVWVMRPTTALTLSLKRTSQDVFAFEDINMNGGTWFGLPVIVSNAVPSSVSGGNIIVLLDPSEIFLADDGGVRIDVSEQASLQMDSAPAAGAQTQVSLWQNNLVGIRAERFINWARRRAAAVTYLDAVAM